MVFLFIFLASNFANFSSYLKMLWLPKGKSPNKKATKKASKKSTKVPGKKKPTADEVQRAFTTFKTKNCKKTTARAMLSYSQFLSLIEGKKQQIWFFLVEAIVEIGIEDVFQPWIVVVPFKFWTYSAQLPFDIVKFWTKILEFKTAKTNLV